MDQKLTSSLPSSPIIYSAYPRDPSSTETTVTNQNLNPTVLTPNSARKIGKLSQSPKDDKPPITPLLGQFAEKNPYRYTTSTDKALNQRQVSLATPSPKTPQSGLKPIEEELIFEMED